MSIIVCCSCTASVSHLLFVDKLHNSIRTTETTKHIILHFINVPLFVRTEYTLTNAQLKRDLACWSLFSASYGINIAILPQDWSEKLFSALAAAGGTAYSNYAVGYNNVKLPAATAKGIAVGNTPGRSVSLPWAFVVKVQ